MADFSTRSATLRSNERTKHFAGVITAWGNALVIATFARTSLRGTLDLYGMGWLTVAAIAMWVASQALSLLETDRDD